MRISFLLPKYPKKPVGGFKVVYEYANYFVSKGHEVQIIHPDKLLTQPLPKGLVNKVKRVGQISFSYFVKQKIPKNLEWQFIDPKVELLYVPTLSEKYIPDADVVIATAWHTADYVKQYSKDKGEKFYLIQHYETWDGPKKRVDKTWKYPINKIVIAKWLLEVGEQLGAKEMIHIPNGIDQSKFIKINDIKTRSRRVSMLYHKSKWKGTDLGISALEIAKKEFPELEAVLFGVTPRGEEIPDWIEYIQRPSQEQLVKEIYNGSSIYLCPSYKEGWGLPAAESIACGCALVSTKNGGVQDFAEDGKTALLSTPGDVNKLAENLISLLKDDNKRIIFAESAHEAIKKFNYEVSGDKFEKHLKEKISTNK